MNYQALTLKSPGIARSIVIPVVASQSKALCLKFGLERIEADVLALVDTGATDTSISDKNHQTVLSFRVPPDTKHIDFVSAENRAE
jgi:hypothetical protein